MAPAIYVITSYKFNHHWGRRPLDARFVRSRRNLHYYLIDHRRPWQLRGKSVRHEGPLDADLHAAGKDYLAEWTFLLAELRHASCEYPLFLISSRFYEKNNWLPLTLDDVWDRLFAYVQQYGWAYLPSYDRPFEWQDLYAYQRDGHMPVTPKGRQLIRDLYGVSIPGDYNWMSDFMCNYIGFASREHLVRYVSFYLPLIHSLLDERYQPKVNLAEFVGHTNVYRKEKPFTFLLELVSHLFFYQMDLPFVGLHYDGFYEVCERHTKHKKLEPLGERRTRPEDAWNFHPLDLWSRARNWAALNPRSPFRYFAVETPVDKLSRKTRLFRQWMARHLLSERRPPASE